jgi:hypothetical protein
LPLYADGLRKIRRNLVQIESGLKPRYIKIGYFSAEQLKQINEARLSRGFQALRPEIVFQGNHLFQSRCVRDGYTIRELLNQIESAFSDASQIDFSPPVSVLRNPEKRKDQNGNLVNDEAVFECTGRHPYADLFSVIPKGDGKSRPGK